MVVSARFRAAVKLGPLRAYQVAQRAGINPSVLSRLMCGIEQPRPADPRILAVAQVLGLEPADCFQ
jgi:transcriptional regulator with XRE-family HTH domain